MLVQACDDMARQDMYVPPLVIVDVVLDNTCIGLPDFLIWLPTNVFREAIFDDVKEAEQKCGIDEGDKDVNSTACVVAAANSTLEVCLIDVCVLLLNMYFNGINATKKSMELISEY